MRRSSRDCDALAREFRQFLVIWTFMLVAIELLTGFGGWWGILENVALGIAAVFVFAVCTTERLYLFADTDLQPVLDEEQEPPVVVADPPDPRAEGEVLETGDRFANAAE